MKAHPLLIVLAALGFAVPAHAQLPAVSGPNGKLAVGAGSVGSGGRSAAVGIADGAVTLPLGHAFGVQLDGALSTLNDGVVGLGAVHLFWRDPAKGLAGPVAVVAGGPGGRLGLYGAEADLYLDRLTLGGSGGYFDAAASRTMSGGFVSARLSVYPLPDLAVKAGAALAADRVTGFGGLEFQPTLGSFHNGALYVRGSAGDDSSYGVTAGLRFYFGADKTLIRRHREDDPPAYDGLSDFPTHPLNPLAVANAIAGFRYVHSNAP